MEEHWRMILGILHKHMHTCAHTYTNVCAHTRANMHIHAHEKWEKKKRKDIDVFKGEEFGRSWGETCVGGMWLRGGGEGWGEKTHDSLFFCET